MGEGWGNRQREQVLNREGAKQGGSDGERGAGKAQDSHLGSSLAGAELPLYRSQSLCPA